MRDVLDVHTHTLSSGHAYSTLHENATVAKAKNLQLLGVSDHAPTTPGSCHKFNFMNLRFMPHDAYGIKLLFGIELNITDYSGSTDLAGNILKNLDYAIASLHNSNLPPGTLEENTAAIIGAIKNPYVVIIGHPDNPRYQVDFDAIAKAAKDNNVLLEVNNSSYIEGYRKGSRDTAAKMLKACQKYGTEVIMGSDAHIDVDVGNHEHSIEVLKQNNFPEELVVNSDVEKFYKHLKN